MSMSADNSPIHSPTATHVGPPRAAGGGYHLAALAGGAVKLESATPADPVRLPEALKGLVSVLLKLCAYVYAST